MGITFAFKPGDRVKRLAPGTKYVPVGEMGTVDSIRFGENLIPSVFVKWDNNREIPVDHYRGESVALLLNLSGVENRTIMRRGDRVRRVNTPNGPVAVGTCGTITAVGTTYITVSWDGVRSSRGQDNFMGNIELIEAVTGDGVEAPEPARIQFYPPSKPELKMKDGSKVQFELESSSGFICLKASSGRSSKYLLTIEASGRLTRSTAAQLPGIETDKYGQIVENTGEPIPEIEQLRHRSLATFTLRPKGTQNAWDLSDWGHLSLEDQIRLARGLKHALEGVETTLKGSHKIVLTD